jgi:hypothetical protein
MGLGSWLRRLFGGRGGEGAGGGGAEMRRLVHLARGDRERAERLIAFELKREPSLSRAEAITKATERLDYEMSR